MEARMKAEAEGLQCRLREDGIARCRYAQPSEADIVLEMAAGESALKEMHERVLRRGVRLGDKWYRLVEDATLGDQ
jgi:hypothetical protein